MCPNCINDKKFCNMCICNPKYHNYFKEYIPTCPRGYDDCIHDPAYIKCHHPDYYNNIYGNLTPEEAIKVKNGCLDSVKEDPDEEYYCYDNEDK